MKYLLIGLLIAGFLYSESMCGPDLQGIDEKEIKRLDVKEGILQDRMKTIRSLTFVTSENIDTFIDSNKYVVLYFYDPHSEGGKELKRAQAEMMIDRKDIKIGFINVNTEKDLVKKYYVTYTPYIFSYVEGTPYLYTKHDVPLTSTSSNSFFKNMEVDYMNKFQPRTINNFDHYYAGYYEKDLFHLVCICRENSLFYNLIQKYSIFEAMTHKIHIFNETDEGAKKLFDVQDENKLVIVNNYLKKQISVPASVITLKELNEFVQNNRYEDVNNVYNTREYVEMRTEPIIVLFLTLLERHRINENFEILQKASELGLKGKIKLFLAGSSHRLATLVGIDAKIYENKLFIITKSYSPIFIDSYQMKSPITPENIVSFYEQFLQENKILVNYQSEINPITKKNLIPLTRSNYDEVLKSKKDTVVFYYRDCDTKCETLLETFQKVSFRLNNNENIQFAVCNVNANHLWDRIRIGFHPLIVLHPASNPKDARDWGQRPKEFGQEALITFIKIHSTVEWKESLPPIHDAFQS